MVLINKSENREKRAVWAVHMAAYQKRVPQCGPTPEAKLICSAPVVDVDAVIVIGLANDELGNSQRPIWMGVYRMLALRSVSVSISSATVQLAGARRLPAYTFARADDEHDGASNVSITLAAVLHYGILMNADDIVWLLLLVGRFWRTSEGSRVTASRCPSSSTGFSVRLACFAVNYRL